MEMKITCTKTEKNTVIDALMNNQFCLHPDDNESCVYDDGCWDCIEASIEWEIKENDDSDGKSIRWVRRVFQNGYDVSGTPTYREVWSPFCPYCGLDIWIKEKDMNVCPHCGRKIRIHYDLNS